MSQCTYQEFVLQEYNSYFDVDVGSCVGKVKRKN